MGESAGACRQHVTRVTAQMLLAVAASSSLSLEASSPDCEHGAPGQASWLTC